MSAVGFFHNLKLLPLFMIMPAFAQDYSALSDEDPLYDEEFVFGSEEERPMLGFFRGSVEGGAVFTSGNTETQTVILKADITNDMAFLRNRLVIDTLFKRDKDILVSDDGSESQSSRTTAERYFVSAQSNYKLEESNESRYLYGAFEKDRFAGYDSRLTISAGWSQRWYETDQAYWDLEFGPGYKRDELSDSGQTNSIAIARANTVYERRLSETSTFKFSLYSDIAISSDDNTASRAETSLITKIYGAFSMKVTYILKHNTKPDDERESLDSETTVTLVYGF